MLPVMCAALIGLVVAIFYMASWHMGAVEAVSLSILVGSSVDYCMHLVEGYLLMGKTMPPHIAAGVSLCPCLSVCLPPSDGQDHAPSHRRRGQSLPPSSGLWLSACLSLCLPVCVYLCPSLYLSVYLSACLSLCLHGYLPACLSASLPACVYLSVCLPACVCLPLPVCLCVCLPVYLSLSVYRFLSSDP